MNNILLRIQEIAQNEGITITAFERVIGASKGVLSRAISNGTDIQSKWLQLIVENYPLYSPRWLLTGKGSMLSKEKNENETPHPTIVTESYVDRKSEESMLYRMYKEKDEENKELLKEIGRLEQKLLECKQISPPVDVASSEKHSIKRTTATSASVQSKKQL